MATHTHTARSTTTQATDTSAVEKQLHRECSPPPASTDRKDRCSHRKLLGFLVPVGEETALLLVDLEVRHLEADRLVRVARE